MKRIYALISLLLIVASCSFEEHYNYNKGSGKLISLTAEIAQVSVTRVNDSGFCDGDAMGIYVVDYSGDQPGTLNSSGNRVDNLRYTYDEPNNKWISDFDVYYKDETTPVDIYGYYPLGAPQNVNSYLFSVEQDQSTASDNKRMGGYEASDFLWGKAVKVTPTESRIMIKLQHKMSCANVELVEGDGFGDGEWSALEKSVVLKNLKRDCSIDLSVGTVTAIGDIKSAGIVPYRKDNAYRAIVAPQTVAASVELFSISVGSVPYTFSKSEAFEYVQGKMHKFTIKVDKKEITGEYAFSLIGEAITAWENDDVSHDASMREYVVVNSTAGGLKDAVKSAGYDYSSLHNLKITGEVADTDFYFMRDSMVSLECLNLKDVAIRRRNMTIYVANEWKEYENVRGIPNQAFSENKSLNRIIFPDNLDIIGDRAFNKSSLTGSLIIPEGVKVIGSTAFGNCDKLNGKLSLPSSLELIGSGAFCECSNLVGELALPNSLECIGESAFYGCKGFSGQLILPEGLSVIELQTFAGCNFSGDLKIPDKCVSIGQHAFLEVPFGGILTLSENMKSIGARVFQSCKFIGPLYLPETLKSVGESAFYNNNFTGNIVLPDGLEAVGYGAFSWNQKLSGYITIPKGIDILAADLFTGCSQIEGVVLHEGVTNIGSGAFAYCYMLNSIVSKSGVPPVVGSGAFDGVPKDNFTVEVPESAIEKYASAEGWRDFHRISAHHELVCRPAYAVTLNSATTRTLVLDAEGDWEVTSIPDWCSLSQVSGGKKTELILTINELAAGSSPRTGDIVFKLKGKDYTHTCKVSQYDYQYKENEVIILQQATKGNNGGINLVFLADGYDGKDISEGKYLKDVNEQVENFFAIHPYKAYREYFNVYTSIAVSPESGVGTLNTIKYNKFETTYTTGAVGQCNNVASTGLKCNNEKVFKYVLDMECAVTENNLKEAVIVLIPNASEYGGITYMWDDGSAIAICPKSTMPYPYDTRGILQHEACGHGFGKLADEYIYHNAFIDACLCTCCEHDIELMAKKARGWYDNLSLSGKMHEVPWSHLIFDDRYSDIVDIYEGGFMHSRGVYRSEYTSCMNNNIPYFSTISRESIVKRIKRYAGEEYSFEDFVSKDSRDMGTVTKGGKLDQEPILMQPRGHSGPVILSGSPLTTMKN